MDDAVALKEVTKIYRLGESCIVALNRLSLKVRGGEFVAIFGRSGSGKSTLLNIIGGLDRPTEGKVFVGGEDLGRLNESKLARFRARNIGFVFQLFNLIPTFSALENVMAPLEILGVKHEEAKERAMGVLKLIGLGSRVSHFPHQLSGGEQQRVAIARALVSRPFLLLCDEPTGNLDSKTGEEVISLLRELHEREGITVIVATHDQRIAASANRILNLVDGRIEGEHL